MLICNNCGYVFGEDEARIEQDKDYVNNGLGMECVRCDNILHCPNCDSEDVDEAKECPVYHFFDVLDESPNNEIDLKEEK